MPCTNGHEAYSPYRMTGRVEGVVDAGLRCEEGMQRQNAGRVYSRGVPPTGPTRQPPTQGQILGLLILTAVLGLHTWLTVW
jgi:hypothetical protein